MKKIIITSILFSILFFSSVESVCIPAFEVGEQSCTGFASTNENFTQHSDGRSAFFFFMPIAGFVFIAVLTLANSFYTNKINCKLKYFRIKRSQENGHTKLFNFIIEIFSGGILHPKMFSLI